MQGGRCHFVCLHVWINFEFTYEFIGLILLGMNQTKYLIRPIIMIITIIRIKNKTRKWTPLLKINSLTYVCVSGGNNFFQIYSYFIKQNSLKLFEIPKTLMITWAVEEYCLEINVILTQ